MKTVGLLSCWILLSIILLQVSCHNTSGTLNSTNKTANNLPVNSTTIPKSMQSLYFDFEKYPTGELPLNWTQSFNGKGNTDWKIVKFKENKVLAQLFKDNPNRHYNVVVYDSLTIKNCVLQVRIKAISGKHDQGGGFVWRYQDKDNYYIVRENPLEDNVVVYKVENGKRTDLPLMGKGRTYGMDVPSLGHKWNTLKINIKDDIFTVFLNDRKLYTVQDNTFEKSGKIGFWTKADAVSYFDEFTIQYETP